VNDLYGHLEGDLVCSAGQIGTNCRRSEDVVARYAETEFVILIAGTIWSTRGNGSKVRGWVASDPLLREKNQRQL